MLGKDLDKDLGKVTVGNAPAERERSAGAENQSPPMKAGFAWK
jgi:hypothetical protein